MNNSLAHETYNIQYWSDGFFCIDDEGYVVLAKDRSVRLENIVQEALGKNNKLDLPLLLRFPDILHTRLNQLLDAFKQAFSNYNYYGSYLPAYPIKVNQEKSVLNSFLEHDFTVALEAGSKPELFTVIALACQSGSEIICNGYKDRDYIKLALLGTKLGINVNIIIEKLSELDLVLDIANELNIEPRLGVRVRLGSLGKGNWQNTGGIKSKFGLTSLQLLSFIDKLKDTNSLGFLKVLHFHMGSQISDLDDIQSGLKEGVRLYAEICREGAKLDTIDVGGGLGVDYEGTSSRSYYSINYNLQSYADIVVKTIKDICNDGNLKHPRIITESGRAMVAHHAVLVTDIIDIEPVIPAVSIESKSDSVKLLEQCLDSLSVHPRGSLEIYHRAKRIFDQTQDLYINGKIHLPERAATEQLFYKICKKLICILDPKIKNHQQLLDILNEEMADKVFCNFSLFQSLPDIWGLEQVFPIMPLSSLHSLSEKKAIRGLIQDMTCDSDGRVDKYIDGQGVENSLPLPQYDKLNPYHIGFFMVGAYQEILGDLHNLFGNTATVDVRLEDNSYRLCNHKSSETILDVLDYVDLDGEVLLSFIKNKYNKRSSSIDPEEASSIISFVQAYLEKSPYFTK